jgi:hypothetical protein
VLEGAISINKKSKAEVSVQQILDCASKYNTQAYRLSKNEPMSPEFLSKGCDGGYLEEAFMYAKAYPLATNKNYPFNGKH